MLRMPKPNRQKNTSAFRTEASFNSVLVLCLSDSGIMRTSPDKGTLLQDDCYSCKGSS